MNTRGVALVCLSIAASLPAAAADTEWLLPNFANRLSVEVGNCRKRPATSAGNSADWQGAVGRARFPRPRCPGGC